MSKAKPSMQIAHTVRLYAVQRLGFDTQHAKPVVSVVEGDALDNTGQGLDRRARLHCGRHRIIMKPSIPRCYRDRPRGACPAVHATEGEGARPATTESARFAARIRLCRDRGRAGP